MRILIIGGTGLIGSFLQEKCEKSGYSVAIVTRDASRVSVPAKAIVADISVPGWTLSANIDPTGFDVVIFMAYATTEDEEYNRRVTVDSVEEAVQFFAGNNLSHFIYVGSMSVFGLDLSDEIIDENSGRVADNDYARNKIDACKAVTSANVDFKVSVLHPTGVYDEHSKRIKMYHELLASHYIVFDDGEQGVNNIVHADDVAEAILAYVNRSAGQRVEEYIVNGEAISYCKWFEVIETKFNLINRFKVPSFMSSLCRGPVRKLLSTLNLRIPVYLPAYKRAMFERQSTFVSDKARQAFGWESAISFNDAMHVREE
jgi:nucleoside-diphosphate-sugar epimerase